jgi:DNA-binding MarR family transcriptional regulator
MHDRLSSAELLIQLIDEMTRGRTRFASITRAFQGTQELDSLSKMVLTAVAMAPHPPTVPQIGRSLGHPRQTIQRQADLLAEMGLVSFVDNPDHKRARRLVPTTEGAAWQNEASRLSQEWAATFTKDIPSRRLAETVETLRMIRERLETEARRHASADASAENDNP